MLPAPLRVALLSLAAMTALPSIPAQHGQDGGQENKGKAVPRDVLVARVGTHEIRESELRREFNRQIPLISYHRRVPPEKLVEYRQKALDKLIEKSLIRQDAIERGIKISEAEIETEFKKTLAKAGKQYEDISDAEFKKLLAQFRPRVVRRILIDKNEARFNAGLPKVKPEALQGVYQGILKNDPESLMSVAEAHLQHIFIKVDPTAVTRQLPKKKARAEEAHALLEKGTPFAEVAREYSEDDFAEKGGDLGIIGRGKFRSSKIANAAFALAAGEYSPVLRSLYGFHIVRCVKIMPRRVSRLEEVRPILRAWVEKQHHEQARKAWHAKMRAHFGVEIKLLQAKPAQQPDPKKG